MNFFKGRSLSVILLAFICGFFAAVSFGANEKVILFIALFSLAFIFFAIDLILKLIKKSAPIKPLIIIVLLALSLSFAMFYLRIDRPINNTVCENEDITARIEYKSANSGTFKSYRIEILSINDNKVNQKSTFSLFGDYDFEIGDVISFNGSVYLLEDDENGYSITDYYHSQGIFTQSEPNSYVTLEEKTKLNVYEKINLLRDKMAETIINRVDGDSGSLMCALLIGKRENLPKSVSLSFRRIGISHALAISGLHLTIIMAFLSRLLYKTKLNKYVRTVILIMFAIVYTVIAGAGGSVLRACGMNILYYLAFLLGRNYDSTNSLTFSVTVILLISPVSVYDLGLLLSFLSTLGIIYLSEKVSKIVKIKDKKPIVKYLIGSLIITMGAMLATLPITSLLFCSFSLLSPITNIFFGVLIRIYLYMAIITLIFPLFGFIRYIFTVFGRFIITFAEKISKLDFAVIDTSYKAFSVIITLFIIIFILFRIKEFKKRTKTILYLALALLFCLTSLITKYLENNVDRLIYVDEKNTEYLLLESNGDRVLFDFSLAASNTPYEITKLLESRHIISIDTYVPNKYSDRTVKNFEKLTGEIRINSILLKTPAENTYDYFLEIAEICAEAGINIIFAEDDVYSFGNGNYAPYYSYDGELLSVYFADIEASGAYISSAMTKSGFYETITENSDVVIYGLSYDYYEKDLKLYRYPSAATIIVDDSYNKITVESESKKVPNIYFGTYEYNFIFH